MANEIRQHYVTAKTLYAVVVQASSGQVWNGAAFENLLAANWGTYAVTLTEQSTTGFYFGTMPAVAAGLYDVAIFLRAGGSPATTDALVGQASIDWSGTVDLGVNKVIDANNRVSVGALAANVITAASINAAALNGKGDWSTYAGTDTAGTTTLLTRIPGTVQPQTGDSYARLGAPAEASIAADIAEIEGEVDTLLAGVTVAGYVAGQDPAVRKNQALANFEFPMYSSTDHVTPKTGLGAGVTCQRSLDGGAFGACANAAVELSNGVYVLNLAAADLNANVVTFRFSGTGADDTLVTVVTQP